MTSNRPYLVRAFYDWIIDNECTPHLLIDAQAEGVQAPLGYSKEGMLILNIAPQAVQHLHFAKTELIFDASFSGENQTVVIPMQAVLGIYAKENGRGMVFEQEPEAEAFEDEDTTTPETKPSKKAPHLRVVK